MASFISVIFILYLSACSVVYARVIGPEKLSRDILRHIEDPMRLSAPLPMPPDFPWPKDPPTSQSSKLDLAFIMDTTGSMSPYINNVRQHVRDLVDAIVASSNTNLRLALIEYRDHKPEEYTFVTRKHDFTNSVWTMKSWLNAAQASGGGDRPEAVAEALYDATTLSWRQDAAKISVLISDAPPHGLVPHEDNSFPDGSPNGHDPIKLARRLSRKKGVTLYTVGCEPSIIPYKDFFMALAYLTGGQYIPLSVPHYLTDAIIGGAKEELSLQKFASDVQSEIQKISSAGGVYNEQEVAKSVYSKLKAEGAKTTHLLRNNKPLEGATAAAKAIANSASMAEVRKIFKKGTSSGTSGRIPSILGRKVSSVFVKHAPIESSVDRIGSLDVLEMLPARRGSSSSGSSSGGSSSGGSGASGVSARASVSESFATVDSAVSLDQITRLVKQEAAKLAI